MRRKKTIPEKGKKFVRINSKTIIEVDIDEPDNVAISNFLEKISRGKPQYLMRRKKPNTIT